MIDDQVILLETGCSRDAIRTETLTGGALPGLILIRSGDEYLCEEASQYLDNSPDCHPTGSPEDYVLVTVPQD